MQDIFLHYVSQILKRALTDEETARAEELRAAGKCIEDIADAIQPQKTISVQFMSKKTFAAGAKSFGGWMEGDIARFPSVYQKNQFETWLEANGY